MTWQFCRPLALALVSVYGAAMATSQSGTGTVQQPESAQAQPAPRVQFENCSRLVSQAKDQARSLAKSAGHDTFNLDRVASQQKDLRTSLGDLKQGHERLYQALTKEQQDSVQNMNANLVQAHDRLQNLVKEMDRELSDSTLHSKDIVEQARATQREMKSYERDFRAMGKELGYLNN